MGSETGTPDSALELGEERIGQAGRGLPNLDEQQHHEVLMTLQLPQGRDAHISLGPRQG